ncbi:MAG: hypothetical protein U0169_02315 [Polyangiaceae bacterium]
MTPKKSHPARAARSQASIAATQRQPERATSNAFERLRAKAEQAVVDLLLAGYRSVRGAASKTERAEALEVELVAQAALVLLQALDESARQRRGEAAQAAAAVRKITRTPDHFGRTDMRTPRALKQALIDVMDRALARRMPPAHLQTIRPSTARGSKDLGIPRANLDDPSSFSPEYQVAFDVFVAAFDANEFIAEFGQVPDDAMHTIARVVRRHAASGVCKADAVCADVLAELGLIPVKKKTEYFLNFAPSSPGKV